MKLFYYFLKYLYSNLSDYSEWESKKKERERKEKKERERVELESRGSEVGRAGERVSLWLPKVAAAASHLFILLLAFQFAPHTRTHRACPRLCPCPCPCPCLSPCPRPMQQSELWQL